MSAPRAMRVLKAGFLYFACVFGAGFALGPFRMLVLVPRIGVRAAELLEMPVILMVIFVSAPWVVRRMAVPYKRAARLAMGGIALGLALLAEFALAGWLRGLTPGEYLADRDPISGTAYYVVLLLFAILPALVERGGASPRRDVVG